jgi:hypothetical protein
MHWTETEKAEEIKKRISMKNKGKRFSPKTEFKNGAKKSPAWYKAMEERIPWNLGKKTGLVPKTAFKSEDLLGDKHPKWKGDDVGYGALHGWVKRELGKPCECVYCGEREKQLDWANIDHKYKRKLEDYISLCRSCHRKYDLNNQNYWSVICQD